MKLSLSLIRDFFPAPWRNRFFSRTVVVVPLLVMMSSCALFRKGGPEPSLEDQLSQEQVPDTSAEIVRNVLEEIPPIDTTAVGLSKEDELVVLACNNYLEMFPKSPKAPDVLQIQASAYYNAKHYAAARNSYQRLFNDHPASFHAVEAVKMVAQSYMEEKNFAKSEEWFRKLKDLASTKGMDQGEAVSRLSESIYRQAERLYEQDRYSEAAKQYERVAIEFPQAKIAGVSLINAGKTYEKIMEWSSAILTFSRLTNQFQKSKHRPTAIFRTGKCYEKMTQWEKAAKVYLTLVKAYPKDPIAVDAIYNAGFCFENADNLPAAAKTFEKTAELYPKSKDAANVLFRAGEIYMRINDWENVARINKIFAKNFGSDKERVVQALCMAGVASRMQKKNSEALSKLSQALSAYRKLRKKSSINTYYAAKSQFTIGEIHWEMMKKQKLVQPAKIYKARLAKKTKYLEKAIESFNKTVKYNIKEWTTQSVYSMGQAFEDFAQDIFEQERPGGYSVTKRLQLETGIAKAVVEYLIGKALPAYVNNVKLGLKLSIEDRWILKSRGKLTMLPYYAATSYMNLMKTISNSSKRAKRSTNVQIESKLVTLQQLAPLQGEAIQLYLKCIEMGVKYQIKDDYTKNASKEVTSISYQVGETYREIVEIAKFAPIPPAFSSAYEKFLYRIRVVQEGVVQFENLALEAYLKNIGIAKAYKLKDALVDSCKLRVGQMLFSRAWCYDALALEGLEYPPFPEDASLEEEELYRGQFEELGFKLLDQATEIYLTILERYKRKEITGKTPVHAYVRLFQIDPEQYGTKIDVDRKRTIGPGPQWKYLAGKPADPIAWTEPGFNDRDWRRVRKGGYKDTIGGFGGNPPPAMWGQAAVPAQTSATTEYGYTPANRVQFRFAFRTASLPPEAPLEIAATEKFQLYLNGKNVAFDSVQAAAPWYRARQLDARTYLRQGKNTIALAAKSSGRYGHAMLFRMRFLEKVSRHVPLPPGYEEPMGPQQVKSHVFPVIPNFAMPSEPKPEAPQKATSSQGAPPTRKGNNP